MPRAFIGTRGMRKPKGVSVLFFQELSHIPSDFVVLISKPERFLNLLSRVSRWTTESRSQTKTVVSSAYKETLISFSRTVMPFMAESFLIALASISTPITNNSWSGQRIALSTTSFYGEKFRRKSIINPILPGLGEPWSLGGGGTCRSQKVLKLLR